MDISLLGPLAVRANGGAVAISARKERRVLARLAISVGHTVSPEELIDTIWGENPPESAQKTSQGYISRLRSVLPEGAIETDGLGYRLQLDGGSTDLMRFDAALGAGRRAMQGGDYRSAVTALEAALLLWRGEALGDLTDSVAGESARARLDEQRAAAREDLAAARIELGDHAQVLADLEEQVTLAPLRERSWELLMLALYRAGRQADALRAYQRARAVLIDEMGIEPGQSMQSMERRILDQDPGLLALATATPEPSGASPESVSHGTQERSNGLEQDGAELSASSGKATTELIAVAFTDLVGSTDFSSIVGDTQAHEIRQQHFALVGDAIVGAGGRVVKTMGDGMMAVFPSVTCALDGAIAMQRAVAAQSQHSPAMRVGLSAGDAYVVDGDYFGMTVTEAARLCAAAVGGQILVSDTALRDARDLGTWQTDALDPVALKGFDGPVAVADLAWEDRQDLDRWPRALAKPERPLVGRDRELRAVIPLIDALITEREATAIFLGGEAGVGKTRLATEIALRANSRGASVVLGRSDEALSQPYGPWSQALASVVELIGVRRVIRSFDRSRVAALANIVPGSDLPGAGTVDGLHLDRTALFDTVGRLLELATSIAPLVIVLDDLQWADESSALLLRHLLHANLGGYLIVATFRSDEVEDHHSIGGLLADTRRHRIGRRFELACLDEQETGALIGTWAGHEPDPAFVAGLFRESNGLPFFVEELLIYLAAEEVVQYDGTQWSASLDLLRDGQFPQSVRDLLVRRLNPLPVATIDVLRDAALFGSTFDLDLVASLRGDDEDDVLTHLDEADGRVIAEVPGTIGRYQFVHSMFRAVLAEDWSTNRRVRRHAAIVDVLGRLRPDDVALQAEHALLAAGLDRGRNATTVGLAACESLRSRAMPEVAADLGRRLLGALAEVNADAAVECDVLVDVALSCSNNGDWAASMDAGHQAVAIARELGDTDRLAQAVMDLGGTGNTLGAESGMFELCDEVLEMLGPGDDPRTVLIKARYAYLLCLVDSGSRSRGIARDAQAMAARLDDPVCTIQAAPFLELFDCGEGDPARRLAHVAHARTAQTLDPRPPLNRWEPGILRLMDALIRLEMGDRATLERELLSIEADAERQRQVAVSYWATQARMTLALLDGQWDAARGFTEQAIAAVEHDPVTERVQQAVTASEIAYWHGDHLLHWEQCKLLQAFLASSAMEPTVAVPAILCGQPHETPTFDESTMPSGVLRRSSVRSWTEFAVLNNDQSLAEQVMPLLDPYHDSIFFIGYNTHPFGATSRLEGHLRMVLGDLDGGVGAFEAAIEMEGEVRAVPMLAVSRVCLAEALVARGRARDRVEVRRLLAEVVPVAEDLEMPWIIERAAALRP